MTDQPTPPHPLDRLLYGFSICFGVFSLLVLLLQGNVADFDIWHCLAMGASVYHTGHIFPRDVFAFTPILDEMVHHEWGAGTFYYLLLRTFGPGSLMAWKVVACFGCLLAALGCARRSGASLLAILLVAPLAGWTILPGYWPVVRPHTTTYLFFAVTLLFAEFARRGSRWPFFAFPVLVLVWVQIHGGFVAGLGAWGLVGLGTLPDRRLFLRFLGAGLAALALTVINPWGLEYWPHHLHALARPRPNIPEWRPLPILASDSFNGFRLLVPLGVAMVALGWKRVESRHWGGLALAILTVTITLRSRRHAPFFGITAAAILIPYLSAALQHMAARIPAGLRELPRALPAVALHAAVAVYTALFLVPTASIHVTAPRGLFPVQEADILAASQLRGNVVTPFHMGGYLLWRLHPNFKVSMDGRYEACYPETTHQMNLDFYFKRGDWQRLVRDYPVDFIILDLYFSPLRPPDLAPLGYRLVSQDGDSTALLVKESRMAELMKALPKPPSGTIDPLNGAVGANWFHDGRYAPELAGPLLAPPVGS